MSHTEDPLDSQLVDFTTMLVVRDLSASEQFYAGHFGFAVTERLESLRRLERPGVSLYLVLPGDPTSDKPGVRLAPQPVRGATAVNLIFRVTDVRAVHSALVAGGLSFLAPPTQPPWGGWRCFTQDPDGHLIEIEQPSA